MHFCHIAASCLLTYISAAFYTQRKWFNQQGRNERGKGYAIPRAPNHSGAPNDCGSAKKSQQCHKHFLQYSTFASERPHAQTWGRQTCFLRRAPSILVTPLSIRRLVPSRTHFYVAKLHYDADKLRTDELHWQQLWN